MKAPIFSVPVLLTGLLFLTFQQANAQHRRYDNYRSYSYYPQRSVYRSYPNFIIPYRGISYHYSNGFFYRPYGASLQVVLPPIGIRVSILPRGYFPVRINTGIFYYNSGVFYRPYQSYYEVVAPPVGAEVPELPQGAHAIVIDSSKYYEVNGTYYKETIRDNGEIWYTVMGKNGVLNTDKNQNNNTPEANDEVNTLPEGSHTVTLNGQTYYVAPDGTYYQQMRDEHNDVYYKIVGKSSVN